MVLFFEVVVLVVCSGIFSGLNIGLVSLSLSDVRRKAALGNKNAIRVLPLRKNMHLSLASILLTNIAIISATSLVIEDSFNGLIAGITSTFLIVIFGEIFPQAFFARYALKFCSFFAPFLRLTILITYPAAKPLQLLLDVLLKNERNTLHSRGELGLIINEQLIGRDSSELDEDEAEIMQSVLTLSNKRVSSIMTPLEKVYYLTEDSHVDSAVIDIIKAHNYSRIPIFNAKLTECRGILLMKDLVDIDFDSTSYPIKSLPLHQCSEVGSKTALDTMFKKFIVAKSHLMIVTRDEKIVGIVTIEDLIEEILGHEIEDESDRKRWLITETNKKKPF